MNDDYEILDAFDPVRRSYRDYWLKMKVTATVVGMMLLASMMSGVPHVQTGYRLHGERPVDRTPVAAEKSAGVYYGPFGRRLISDGQYGHRGCPTIVLVPLIECLREVDLQEVSARTSSLFAGGGGR